MVFGASGWAKPETQVDLVDVTAQDSDSTESFVAVDSRSEVLSDDQERDGASVFEGGDPVALQIGVPNREALGLGLRRLDEIDLVEHFQRRQVIMRSVPVVMSGSFKAAMRLAIDEVADGVAVHDEAKQERGWKLFLLLPRMLQRPSRGGLVPKSKLLERLRRFANRRLHWFVARGVGMRFFGGYKSLFLGYKRPK